ncbi:MAG: radical SAM protein [Saccharofermentanales bacterium]
MQIASAYIEITDFCNLNCQTCYNRSGLNKNYNEITFLQMKEIIDILKTYGCQYISFAGGEPCLNSKIDDILELPEIYPELKFSMSTNGTIYNKKLINLYKNNPDFFLQISLDGSCEKINAKTRGSGNFVKTIDFIKLLQNDNKKLKLKMVVSQNNINDVQEFFKLSISLNCIPEFTYITCSGNGHDDWENKKIDAKQKLQVLKLINILNNEYSINSSLPFCTSSCPMSEENTPKAIAIKTNGSIMPCQLLYNDKYKLGNIFDFNKYDFDKKLNEITHFVLKRIEIDYGCKKCVINKKCLKGCMANAVNLTDDPFSCDGDCNYRKLQLLGFEMKNIKNKFT